MLEIVIVYFLCKGIGDILRKKNRSPLPFQIMTVVFWIGGELTGGVVWLMMMVLTGQQPKEFDLTVYLFLLVGAAIGGGLSFLIASLVPAAEPPQPVYSYGQGMPTSGNPYNPYDPSTPPQPPKNPFADR